MPEVPDPLGEPPAKPPRKKYLPGEERKKRTYANAMTADERREKDRLRKREKRSWSQVESMEASTGVERANWIADGLTKIATDDDVRAFYIALKNIALGRIHTGKRDASGHRTVDMHARVNALKYLLDKTTGKAMERLQVEVSDVSPIKEYREALKRLGIEAAAIQVLYQSEQQTVDTTIVDVTAIPDAPPHENGHAPGLNGELHERDYRTD